MKKLMFTVLFVCVSVFTYSQSSIGYSLSKSKYDIFLLLDSEKNEMLVNSDSLQNSLTIKIFKIVKIIPQEKEKYILDIDKNGKIRKSIRGATSTYSDCCRLTLAHVPSNQHTVKKFLKIKDLNIISYKDILNSKIKNIIQIVSEATNIYVIDIKDVKDDELYYTAYEVSL